MIPPARPLPRPSTGGNKMGTCQWLVLSILSPLSPLYYVPPLHQVLVPRRLEPWLLRPSRAPRRGLGRRGRVHFPHRAPLRMRPSWVLGVQVGPRQARPPHLSRGRPLPLHRRPGRHVWPLQGLHPVDCLGPSVSAMTAVATPATLPLPVSVLSLASLLPAPFSVALSALSSTPVSALLVPVVPVLVLPVS